jgi:hypothetical protein
MTKIIGMTLLFLSLLGVAAAADVTVPEINPASGVGALALFSGALLVIRSRRK